MASRSERSGSAQVRLWSALRRLRWSTLWVSALMACSVACSSSSGGHSPGAGRDAGDGADASAGSGGGASNSGGRASNSGGKAADAGGASTTAGGTSSNAGGTATDSGGPTGGSGGTAVVGDAGPSWYTLTVGSPPLIANIVPDTARAVTALVPRSGGQLVATGADGTKYTLTVPATALAADMTITMTPLASLSVTDLPAEQAVGVVFDPDGESFVNWITLTITPKAGTTWAANEQIPISFDGTQRRVSLAILEKTAEVRLPLLHFSGYALLLAKKGFDASLAAVRHRFGGNESDRLTSAAAELFGRERLNQLLGAVEGGDLVPGFEALRAEFMEKVLKPRLAAAADSCAAARLANETLLGYERQNQLLGVTDDPNYPKPVTDLLLDSMINTARVCMKEEYELCRDNHIITRILPGFLKVMRTAELLNLFDTKVSPPPAWVMEVEAYLGKCLKFELQLDGTVSYAQSNFPVHTMTENVTSRVKIDFGLPLFAPLPDSPQPIRDFEGMITGNLQTMTSSGYGVSITEDCVTLNSKQSGNGQLGVGFMTFTAGTGSVTERATVKDFGLSVAVQMNLSQYNYTVASRDTSTGTCKNPSPNSAVESYGTVAAPLLANHYITDTSGVFITGWQVTQGSDIPATKDIGFTELSDDGAGTATWTAKLVLFHTPMP